MRVQMFEFMRESRFRISLPAVSIYVSDFQDHVRINRSVSFEFANSRTKQEFSRGKKESLTPDGLAPYRKRKIRACR